MKKLLLIISISLIACLKANFTESQIIIIEIYDSNQDNICFYKTNYDKFNFIDSCGKFNVNDTIQIIKK